MRSTNSKTGEPLLPLPSRPGWIPAPRSSTRIISLSFGKRSPLTQDRCEKGTVEGSGDGRWHCLRIRQSHRCERREGGATQSNPKYHARKNIAEIVHAENDAGHRNADC